MIQNQNMSIYGFLAEYVDYNDLSNQGPFPILVEENRFRRMRGVRKKHHISGRIALGNLLGAIQGDVANIEPGKGGCHTRNGMLLNHWSISHTDHGAVAVKSTGLFPIGVDMEPKSRPVDRGALDQIAAQDLKKQTPYLTNLETWMAIEAVSKATGYGLSISREISYSRGAWRFREESWEVVFEQRLVGGVSHLVSIARLITEAP
tara:strand:- start:1394 stop:2008 length:615 start_codon:yes stop_codon:yes gene_type:complete